jgi:hypothetical protein
VIPSDLLTVPCLCKTIVGIFHFSWSLCSSTYWSWQVKDYYYLWWALLGSDNLDGQHCATADEV